MENLDDEDGQGAPGTPNLSGGKKSTDKDRPREGQGDQESARPGPSGVPNEGRAREILQGEHHGGRPGPRRYSFKGQGPVDDPPTQQDANVDDSADSSRTTAVKPDEDRT